MVYDRVHEQEPFPGIQFNQLAKNALSKKYESEHQIHKWASRRDIGPKYVEYRLKISMRVNLLADHLVLAYLWI